ncbi:hypothetical protein [Neobacillus citreus]|uniref:Uncharacterized protein n=1 Tax=Neobacillus citreus TaxID=2833578 RepID=A0A942SVL8_9BACI|nr:hypothetical protein [Neobacillus citreus]MCH6264214.1 hypothetical protein [Neobacillus citreus]
MYQIANITENEKEKIKQLEHELGLVLIAYDDKNGVQMTEYSKDLK